MANPIKLKATVSQIQQFGQGTYLVQFAPHGNIPKFKAGQFLHLTIDEYDPMGGFWPESRVFSIASAPNDKEIKILYSVKGKYTARMERELTLGREVWLKLPYGLFIIDAFIKEQQDVVLIAGGTGVSPFLPYLQSRETTHSQSKKVRLYYGTRENALLAAIDTIQGCGEAGILDARVYIENEQPSFSNSNNITFFQGRLDIEKIRTEIKGLNHPLYFLSGPPAMIFAFKAKLLQGGVMLGNIIIDEWE